MKSYSLKMPSVILPRYQQTIYFATTIHRIIQQLLNSIQLQLLANKLLSPCQVHQTLLVSTNLIYYLTLKIHCVKSNTNLLPLLKHINNLSHKHIMRKFLPLWNWTQWHMLMCLKPLCKRRKNQRVEVLHETQPGLQ